MSNILIPWKALEPDSYKETIKWSHGHGRYEIYMPTLDDLDLAVLLPHCLNVLNKVKKVVTTNNHLGPSLFQVFPRTLSIVLQSVWDVIIDDEDNEICMCPPERNGG